MKDLNLLYTFEALWRDRSVTQAADRLGVTQAAVSSALKRLRQEYDDKLFTLVGRQMEPTPQAVELSTRLLDALALVRRSHAQGARFDPATAARQFTLRTRDIAEVVCLPHLVASLALAAPKVHLRTVFHPLDVTLSGLASGQIDVALGFLPSLETGIHRKPLLQQHYVCAMRSGHPAAGAPLTPEVLRAYDHLLVEYSGSGHKILERAMINAGLRQRIRARMPQYLSAPHLVVASDLLWIAPAILVQRLAAFFPLVARPVPLPLPTFEIGLYWHERFHRDPANKWLRDFMGERIVEDIEADGPAPVPAAGP